MTRRSNSCRSDGSTTPGGPWPEDKALTLFLQLICRTTLVKPQEAQVWDNGLGTVLRPDPEEVHQARLLTPDLLDLTDLLRSLDAENLADGDFVQLLRFCCNGSLMECVDSWRVLVSSLERANEFPDALRQVPCWWTNTGARALDGSRPLLLNLPEDWPSWLPADSLDPQMREELKQWEAETSDKQTGPLWRELVSERLLREPRECLQYALLPFIATWDMTQWEVGGWGALRQVLCWSEQHEFEATAPWIEDPDSRKGTAMLRGQIAKVLRLPTDKGWVPAADCYAGEAWSGPGAFDRYFAGIEDRGVLRSFKDWPASIEEGADQAQWKALLRWSGVSWEPKVRHVNGLPAHELTESYRDQIPSYYRWLIDWKIEYFPDCLLPALRGTPASVIRTMLPLVSAVEEKRAKYYRSRYFEKKGERQWADATYAAYQLRNEEWLPCKRALFHDRQWVAPRHAFLPDKGLRGLLPEVERGALQNEEWYQQIDPALRCLEVRDQLPADPLDWHSWMRKLPGLYQQVHDFPKGICETLYRRYLKLELVIQELPEDIDIPCIVWKDGSGELEFAPPCQVFHVDQPHFEEARDEILREGYRLFIIRLGAGEEAPTRLGLKSLSDVLQAEPAHEASDHQEKQMFLQRYRDRRRGLSLAAKLENELREELDLEAVRRLRLRLISNGATVTDVDVLSWLTEDRRLLVNLDRDKWRALGHGLAVWIAREVGRASMFENLLRESDKEEYLDRLRQEGVTEDDILDAGSAWEGAPPPEEQSYSSDDTPLTASGNADEGEPAPQKTGSTVELSEPSDRHGTPDSQPTSAEPKPRPEAGLVAEDWLAERLERAFPGSVSRHDRDDENRESDFVIDGVPRVHIEVKHAASRPGTFHWSGLQCEKALGFEGSTDEYVMALLFPEHDQEYEIRWVWRPLEVLRKARREVQWAGTSGYQRLDTESWDVSSRQPLSVPTKRYEFRIRLTDETLAVLEKDTGMLEALRTRFRN